MFKNKKIRNWIIAIVAIAIVAFVAVQMILPASASTSTAAQKEKVIAIDVAETIEASGTLDAQPFASLAWKTSGIVEKVNVQPGDMVKAGDVLLALQPASTSSNIVAAQADLVNAQQELDDLLNSGTSLAQAAIDLKDAQEAYTKADNYLRYLQTSESVPQTIYESKLVSTNRNGWQYEYDLQNYRGPAPEDWILDAKNDLALKKAELDDAQRNYDSLLAGEDSADVIAAKANVEAAQVTVSSLYITAPFDGKVLAVKDVVGDLVDANAVSVYVADMNRLYVDAQVDESDVAKVKMGQQVDVTLDALAGVTLTGTVTAINPVGEEVSGLVKYSVHIDLDKVTDQDFIPLGTTANVTIHVMDATASLTVPITTIQNDAKGEFVLVAQRDGSTKRVDVVTGAIVGDKVVVTGDLREGDVIQVNDGSSFNAPNPFGGGTQ
ncbi:MAG: efflux RND transporter periplasmic adaptor subunit [Anaerolineales bacterium]|nr:efflux RND transporter periplasmic adaptor subunit [Anaerolineales bacterium]